MIYERLKEESDRLDVLCRKLQYALNDPTSIPNVSADELEIMRDQLYHMNSYHDLLRARLDIHRPPPE